MDHNNLRILVLKQKIINDFEKLCYLYFYNKNTMKNNLIKFEIKFILSKRKKNKKYS